MRLICPNCDAQYEVDDGVIPLNGRDVQCSNCGHTWFQIHQVTEASRAAEAEAAEADPVATPEMGVVQAASGEPAADPVREHGLVPEAELQATPEPAPVAIPQTAPEPVAAAQIADPLPVAAGSEIAAPASAPVASDHVERALPDLSEVFEAAEEDPLEAASVAKGTAAALKKRTLDDAVLGVLRAEADRETRARQAEQVALETQPDLGLTDPPRVSPTPPKTATPPRKYEYLSADDDAEAGLTDAIAGAVAASQVDPDPGATQLSPPRASRRDLLPDIEEINSTLRATSDKGRDTVEESFDLSLQKPRKRGFRFGFSTVLLIAGVLALIYAFAPGIAAKVPALQGTLDTYVALVNSGRFWLDELMKSSLTAIQGASGG